MIVKQSSQRGYEKEVHSAGVHETAGGALKVYSEEEELDYCPKCELDAKISYGADTQDLVV